MVRTGTRTLEEVDGVEALVEALVAEAAVIAVTISETTQSQNIYLKER